MFRPKRMLTIWIGIFILVGTTFNAKTTPLVVYSQTPDDETCADILTDALQVIGESCHSIGQNQVCYGHREITAALVDEVSAPFAQEGDTLAHADWNEINGDGADLATGNYGVAVSTTSRVSPEIGNAGLTLVLLGETTWSKAESDGTPACSISNPGPDNINLRGGASTDFGIRGRFEVGATGIAVGRDETGEWVLISADDLQGWVYTPLAQLECNVETLPVLELMATTAPIDTTTAYHLSTNESPECRLAPNGVLLRSTEGNVARIRVNGVDLAISGTHFLSTTPDEELSVRALEGEIEVNVAGQSVPIVAGFSVNIPQSEALPSDPPITAEPIDSNTDTIASALTATRATLIQNDIGIEHCLAVATDTIDYLTGPGVRFDVAGQLSVGQEILVIRQVWGAEGGGWWQLGNSGWVRMDAVQVRGDCSLLSGRDVLQTTVRAAPPSQDNTPICGIIWDVESTTGATEDDIDLETTAYLVEGTQIYLESRRDNGEVAISIDGSNGTLVDDSTQGENVAQFERFTIESDGSYTLHALSRGAAETSGSVFGVALCP